MKWSLKIVLLFIGALLCRAEIDVGNTSGQDVTDETEESKVTPEQNIGTTRKDAIPVKIPSVQSLADALPGVPLPPSSEEEDMDSDFLPFKDSNLEEGKKVLEEKCRELGGEAAVESATLAKDRMMECAQSMVNVTQLQGEIDDNKANGELDTVFKKYCRKAPHFQECLTNFTIAIDPCLKDREKVTKDFIYNVTDSLLSFICYKEGDRIALFIAEGGPECLAEKQQEVQNCMNSTLAKHLPKNMPDAENLPEFVLEEAQCLEINDLQSCVVKSLEGCKEPTPANIVESMMNYLKKSGPCAQYFVVNRGGSFVNPMIQTVLSSFVAFILLAFK